ncbi:sulfatase-like hydrolase/transferase, partial [Candidatus Bathyarchaeota archaeon]|nr:sulfatase-like hydrolase/transferase [Candidatus Bathyarchaeota archaeon]
MQVMIMNEGRKNVLFIFADQMHRYALGCMDDPNARTPNLDQLAAGGVLFKNAYSNCPICTPFRINLFTGLYTSQTDTFRNQSRIPDGITTLAERFNKHGYKTSYVGKWHIGATGNKPIPEELRAGFQEFIGYFCYNGFYKDVIFHDEDCVAHEFDGHRTDVTTDIALERLERIAGDPFFMCVSYQAPHYPVQPAPEYAEMFDGIEIQRRKNTRDVDPYTGTHSPPSPKPPEKDPDFRRYGNDLDEYLRLYHAMVAQIDANVGRLLDKLDELGITDDTVVVFTSDHGDMQGSHGLKNKTLPHEESAGIPLIIKEPGGAVGMVAQVPVSGVDFYPTCLEYAGIEAPGDLPGLSLAQVTATGDVSRFSNRPVFSEMRDWKMIRHGNLKLVVRGWFYEPTAFFNLERDPYELDNLIDEESWSNDITRMRDKLMNIFTTLSTYTWLGATLKNLETGEE